MNVSRRWLEDLLRRPLPLDELVERLALLGAPVDAVEPLHAELAGVRVGVVEEVRPHPNADRLSLCRVDDGSGTRREVVCGATNVTAGGKYPFAPVGTTLPGGLVLEKRKIRGEVSEGMLCSARELGLGQDHEGILALATDAPAGTPLLEVLALADDRLEVDVSPNRPDLLGHKGLARELAAGYDTPFRLPPIPGTTSPGVPAPVRLGETGSVGGVRVAIEDAWACPRFLGATIRGVRVGPSPEWLRRRLEAVGVRAINNVVDATNYAMLELNQPMHAYDVARLRGPAVVARGARPGETLTTLDGVSRILADGMLAIADDGGAIGIAGVMGGEATEVGPETVDVFLECAFFDPTSIRRTRRALGLVTEASYRFERGIDRWGGPDALRRGVAIILATAGGRLDGDPIDLWPHPSSPPRVFLRPSRVSQVLGVDLDWRTLERYLVAIGATVVAKPDDGRMAVDVPGWRPDLREEIDLVEEIARLHGYDAFPSELRPYRVGALRDAPSEIAETHVRVGLSAEGLYEAITLPMGPAAPDAVPLLNPLSAEEAHLRTALLPGLVRRVEANWAAGTRDVRLFEIGTVFRLGDVGAPPLEERRVAGVVTGARAPAHWTASAKAEDLDRWDLRGLFDAAVGLAIPGAAVQVDGSGWAACVDGRVVGWARPLDGDAPPWAAPLFGFELAIDAAPRGAPAYRPLPTTPASERDAALLLPAGVTAQAVIEAIRQAGGDTLETVSVVDEYRGAGVPAGHRSVAFRLRFRAADRTLRDADVEASLEKVLKSLRARLAVERRAADGGGGR